jgi:hypothetical protein
MRTHEERARRAFVDALRECIGLAPLYRHGVRPTIERFYLGSHADLQGPAVPQSRRRHR